MSFRTISKCFLYSASCICSSSVNRRDDGCRVYCTFLSGTVSMRSRGQINIAQLLSERARRHEGLLRVDGGPSRSRGNRQQWVESGPTRTAGLDSMYATRPPAADLYDGSATPKVRLSPLAVEIFLKGERITAPWPGLHSASVCRGA